LIDAGVGVGDLLLHERAARAAGPDREAQRAVGLDQVLLGHNQRLGLGEEVAVVAGVVEGGGHHREPETEGGAWAARSAGGAWHADGVTGGARGRARLVVDAAAGPVGDQQLVYELGLRVPRRPRL